MSAFDPLPKALFGGLLEGTNAVRFIFADEAGTSDSREETVRIVAGVIVHADTQLLRAERLVREAVDAVPEEFKTGFKFHAEEILNNREYQDRWRLTDRLNLLKSMMSIPRKLGLPVSFGLVRANAPSIPALDEKGVRLGHQHQMSAFHYAMTKADAWIREHGHEEEIATVVHEACDIQQPLLALLRAIKANPVVFGPEHLVPRKIDLEQGYNAQDGTMRITRIRDTIHFVGKDDDPLVWIADAVAYGLKRCFAQLQHGEEFSKAISGGLPHFPDWKGIASGGMAFKPT